MLYPGQFITFTYFHYVLQLRTLRGGHGSRFGALDWNNHILTTGGMDGRIINNDVRMRAHIVEMYSGHHREVCGLTWSASGQQLASGGNDNLLHIWDRSTASSNAPTQWLHRLQEHTAAFQGLAWCPWQGNLLASGGGQNQPSLWKYPSMMKIAELTGHTSRVLFMVQSPDGCTVASAAGDETLRFWNVFGTPEVAKSAPEANSEPFSDYNRVR
ncbi:unnamed protein product [Fraxinus pennsylvanica]|uniref:Uncharacterized protein n=1 Tax=Fraxinus pennsylvanica TaxID=56036 RepID=A0AAD1Z2Y1_9LAMI|nr:unnamed protein product [Fraxinus pennsylvanica]